MNDEISLYKKLDEVIERALDFAKQHTHYQIKLFLLLMAYQQLH